ncbi:hypothetical protein HPB50_023002 [Hyalomma asiaticum]|uniref:Uncharacterized protein n=1 Tax=Hyalomma asiaticum TaxID=266040 RepID=A0ACB7T0Y4_HYAAI|nr:hypothetical protein HPB50_023002 [Hyalomma asiaticum]
MQKLKQQSEELEENVLESRLKDLIPKQKLVIMQCFLAARLLDHDSSSVKQVDSLIDNGKLEEASGVLEMSALDVDHVYTEKTSDARLVYYIAGYVARKTVLKSGCRDCFDELLVAPQGASKDLATLTHFCDNGGVLYPSEHAALRVRRSPGDDLHDMVQL